MVTSWRMFRTQTLKSSPTTYLPSILIQFKQSESTSRGRKKILINFRSFFTSFFLTVFHVGFCRFWTLKLKRLSTWYFVTFLTRVTHMSCGGYLICKWSFFTSFLNQKLIYWNFVKKCFVINGELLSQYFQNFAWVLILEIAFMCVILWLYGFFLISSIVANHVLLNEKKNLFYLYASLILDFQSNFQKIKNSC